MRFPTMPFQLRAPRPLRGLVAAFAVLVTLLAGCTGAGPGSLPEDTLDGQGPALRATATTGVLRGVVFDQAIRPVPSADIALRGPDGAQRSAVTDESGFFGFAGLAPGTYFVTVDKLAYTAVQQSIEVVAGIDEPPIVKLQVTHVPSEEPFLTKVQVEAFVQCIVPGANLCAIINLYPCATVGYCEPTLQDTSHVAIYDELVTLQRVPDWYQSEMVWESTQSLSPDLATRVSARSPDDGTGVDERQTEAKGPSPLVTALNRSVLEEWEVGLVEGVGYEIFGHMAATSAIGSMGIVLNQRVSFYFDVFYGYAPPEGWRFSVDSTFPPPR